MYFLPPEPLAIVKRGDGGVPFTETSYATAKPSSSYHHGKPLPTVGGSFGGFIGLVVGLGIFTIISSAAAYLVYRRYQRNKSGVRDDGANFFGFKRGKRVFGRKKNKGWIQTHSYTDGDEDGIGLDQQRYDTSYNNTSTADVGARAPGKIYDDPFNADSLDNLQKETSARIDRGPEYQPLNKGAAEDDHVSPVSVSFPGGTKFKEGS